MSFTRALATNNYGPAKFIVDGTTVANGTHSTIASALTSASSGDTIFIRPGTYTENITLKAGVCITAFNCDAQAPNVIILGKASFSSAGTATLSGVRLKTNSDFCLSVTGSVASIVKLNGCFIEASNNTAIQFTSSSASALIHLEGCYADIGTTGIAYFSSSSAGSIRVHDGYWQNTGLSTTASTFSAGNFFPFNCAFDHGFALSSTASMTGQQISINGAISNMAALALTGTSSANLFHTFISGGTASAATVAAGCTLAVDFLTANSSNTNTLDGGGTISYGLISYVGGTLKNNITTQNQITTQGVVKVVRTSTAAATSVAGTIPFDDTIPQNTEGSEIMTVTITPCSATNILEIQAVVFGGNNITGTTIALFQDSTANALAAGSFVYSAVANMQGQSLLYSMTAATTSSTTFKIRFGSAVGNTQLNGNSTGRKMGGVMVSYLKVTEHTS